jgi:hypothetical protein
MYDLIFIIYYKLFSRTPDSDPEDSAINLITIVIFFHLFFLYCAINFVVDASFVSSILDQHNKYYYLPLVIIFMVLIHRLYKKRFKNVVDKFQDRNNILSWGNIAFAIGMTLLPLFLGIYFLNHS